MPRNQQFSKCFLRLFVAATISVLLISPGPARGQLQEHFRLGTQAMARGDFAQASSEFEAVVRENPSFAPAQFNLGLAHQQLGRQQEAVEDFRRALRLNAALRGANLFLGIAYYKLNNFSPAREAVQREIKLNPQDPQPLMWLGLIELGDGRPQAAVPPLDRAAEIAPKDIDILYHRGRAHLLASKNSFQQMYELDPQSWRVHQVLAQSYAESERYADAVAEYQRAIQIAPNEPSLNQGLGDAYRMSTQLENAETAYGRELELDPHNLMAMYSLAQILIERDSGAQALPLLEAVLQENPNFIEARYYLGRGLAQVGRNEEAEKQFHRVVTDSPDAELVQRTYYQLGRIYRALNKPLDAQQAMQEFQRRKQAADAREAGNLDERKKSHAERQSEADPH
jgi:tetratricopeptide (TPR) repeat protein